jgi:hypothetical protein
LDELAKEVDKYLSKVMASDEAAVAR